MKRSCLDVIGTLVSFPSVNSIGVVGWWVRGRTPRRRFHYLRLNYNFDTALGWKADSWTIQQGNKGNKSYCSLLMYLLVIAFFTLAKPVGRAVHISCFSNLWFYLFIFVTLCIIINSATMIFCIVLVNIFCSLVLYGEIVTYCMVLIRRVWFVDCMLNHTLANSACPKFMFCLVNNPVHFFLWCKK